MKRPKVNEVEWANWWESKDGSVKAELALEDRDFMRVRIQGGRPKYFFGELAYQDIKRYISDQTGSMEVHYSM